VDTLLLMMFLGLRKLGNICCGHKMFLNKIRNIFCVPDTKFVSATMLRAQANRETFVSATMCPQQCVLVLKLDGDTELARAVDVMMERAKRLYTDFDNNNNNLKTGCVLTKVVCRT